MIKYIGILFSLVITSFYFFPFVFKAFPIANTKLVLAVIGLIILGINLSTQRRADIKKDFIKISFFALLVSFIGVVSTTYNETSDFTYASYIISMWVWMSAAYTFLSLIQFVHGSVSVKLICHYLMAVCVIQCFLALLIDSNVGLKSFVDSIIKGDGFMGVSKNRLYGIGASLDVAGTRFAAVLLMIAYLLTDANKKQDKSNIGWYVFAFLVIAVVGNMISRTTTVGLVLALLFLIFFGDYSLDRAKKIKVVKWCVGMLIMIIPIVVYLYNTNYSFHSNIRFAFEGFFSLVEKGSWEVHSNDILVNMVVYPETLKTWIIGDGYFDNPYLTNEFFIGKGAGTFYMNTDIGYLRFIFYFGVIGLLTFMIFMYNVGILCGNRLTNYKTLFMLLLVLNFIIWFKVSTDIFVVFAPFLCLCLLKEENTSIAELQ